MVLLLQRQGGGRCVGLEQAGKEHGVKILSFDPGLMDPAMQETIRAAGAEDFPESARFVAFKEEGRLRPADFVAERLARVLFAAELEQGAVLDVESVP